MTAKTDETKTETATDRVVTPYEGAKIMTARLAEMGITHTVKGPMIYIYGRDRKAFAIKEATKTTKKGTTQKVWAIADMTEFLTWMEDHIKRVIVPKFNKQS